MRGFDRIACVLLGLSSVALSGCGGDDSGSKSSSAAGSGGTSSSSGGTSSSSGGTSSSSGGTSSSAGQSGGGTATTEPGMGAFVASAVFYQDISSAALDAESETIMGALQAIGWGDPDVRTELGIDFSFNINQADESVTPRAFTPSPDFYSPDCDTAPVPLPPGGKGEGVDDYACDGGDCHLFVYQGTRYYELYQSNITGGQATGGEFTATCLALWDLTRDYWVPKDPPDYSRGDGCTGADAADLPMAPLILTKEELTAGKITHALRFTISNNRIASGVYVRPATHLGGPSGDATMPPYGARLRLRGDFDLSSLPSDEARTVAKALQTYGMYLADGGNIYISATIDASDSINNSILSSLEPRDFEMVDGGTRINSDEQNCPHVPVTE